MLRPWQVTLGERIDPERGTPIYMQIIHALIRDIETGRLASGTYLPSSRELAGRSASIARPWCSPMRT